MYICVYIYMHADFKVVEDEPGCHIMLIYMYIYVYVYLYIIYMCIHTHGIYHIYLCIHIHACRF